MNKEALEEIAQGIRDLKGEDACNCGEYDAVINKIMALTE